MEFVGYQTVDLIYQSTTSKVYRAQRSQDGVPVILKVLNAQNSDQAHLARYRQEYENVRRLNFPEASKVHRLVPLGASCMLEMEDVGGSSLASILAQRPIDVRTGLEIAEKVAAQLACVHQSKVIHKDVTPGNIVWNPTTGQVRLIDFGISSSYSSESASYESVAGLEGTLAYIAPEQTGRMNRAVDYRSDLYSLGATLYELFTGRPPFVCADPLELVHCHLARLPELPESINPAIPQMLSRILMRLLKKGAEERYQSAEGLGADLRTCLAKLTASGEISEFPLGESDFGQSLQISQKLYGREKEIATLLGCFSRVAAGRLQLVVVCGYSGVGKTSVIHEVYRPITEKRGLFASGKYDQFQGHVPNGAIIAAFRSLLRQLLAEDEVSLQRWRQRLRAALGGIGAVVAEVIPELEHITGPLEPLAPMNQTDAQSRFQRAFRQFVRALAAAEHPLVLFLDDLQWADPASLKLIELLMTDPEAGHLLLIGAYRDNEVDAVHPLTATLSRLELDHELLQRIMIRPLGERDLVELLADTLNSPPAAVRALAQRLAAKTGGNPFFVVQFIKMLYRKGLLVRAASTGTWSWDLDRIDSLGVTDNLVELIKDRLHTLPAATQQALRMAALLGNHFSLGQLAASLSVPLEQAYETLQAAAGEGMVTPLSRREPVRVGDVQSALIVREFGFAHDRLQQAAFELIPPEERTAVHLRIGRLLRGALGSSLPEEDVFGIVGHLNRAEELISAADERLDLARLNLKAGQKALAGQASASAAVLLAKGIRCLPADAFTSHHDLAFGLYTACSIAEAQLGKFTEARELLQKTLEHVTKVSEKLRVYSLLMNQHGQIAEYHQCLEVAIAALALFGIELPRTDFGAHIGPAMGRLAMNLQRRSLREFSAGPTSEDADLSSLLELVSSFVAYALFIDPALYLLNTITGLNITLERGLVSESIVIIVMRSMALMITGQFHDSIEHMAVALQLTERFPSVQNQFYTKICSACFIMPWSQPIAATYELQEQGFHIGLRNSLPLTGMVPNNKIANWFYGGVPLAQVDEFFVSSLKFLAHTTSHMAYDIVAAVGLTVRNLRGRTSAADTFHGEGIESAEALLQRCAQNQSAWAIGCFYIARGMLKYLYGDPRGAIEELDRAEPLLPTLFLCILQAHWPLYLALAAAQLIPSGDEQQVLRQRLERARARLDGWAQNCPANFSAQLLLVDGERALLDGQPLAAVELFARSAEAAQQYGFPDVQGTAEERLADLWLARGRKEYAALHAGRARDSFTRWGAARKVALLSVKFRELGSLQQRPLLGSPLHLSQTLTTTSTSTSGALDVLSVAKASQSIAEELVFERLLQRLTQVLLEQAGAQHGALLLLQGDELVVEADSRGAGGTIAVRTGIALPRWQGGAHSIVQWVRRTQEIAIVDNAAEDPTFRSDPYVLAHRTKSVLCTPIKNRAGLMGIVYLENDLSTGTFSLERIEVTRILAGQVAVSLENARLYDELTRALQKAQESERLKTEFLANTSHELRTPLNSIINIPLALLQLLAERTIWSCPSCGATFEPEPDAAGVPPPCPECQAGPLVAAREWYSSRSPGELRTYLESVKTSGQHLLAILDNILDFSRLDAGRAQCRSESLVVPQVFAAVALSLKPLAEERRVTLHFLSAPDAPPLQADPVKLRQILTNLIGNAIKFSHPGGRVEVRHTVEGTDCVLSVRDWGIGIPLASQQYIFERFRQVEAGHTRAYGGTGLGLAITKKLVELHGGQLTVDSELGQGSTFMVRLPLHGSSGPATSPGVQS